MGPRHGATTTTYSNQTLPTGQNSLFERTQGLQCCVYLLFTVVLATKAPLIVKV